MITIDTKEVEAIISSIEPKIKKSLNQTGVENRDDLEQELKVFALNTILNKLNKNVPDFFTFVEQTLNKSNKLQVLDR